MSDKVPFLLTLVQVSEKTGIPVRTLSLRIKDGSLRATKPGRHVLVYWESVLDMLKRNQIRPKAS